MFGTFRMPENALPAVYGKDEPAIPSEIAGNWPTRSGNCKSLKQSP